MTKRLRILAFFAAMCAATAFVLLPRVEASTLEPVTGVDLVVVDKTARTLSLMRGGEAVRTFPVQLGDAPRGHKGQEGDERTPEGRYTLDWRNPNSSYHLSIHVSYPNADDKRRAAERGVDPGGMIMIHGQPNGWGPARHLLRLFDWTDGCIALSNEQMDVVWQSVPNGTPIDILP